MIIDETLTDAELQRVLWACLDYWSSEEIPLDERVICYSWVVRRYKTRFGLTFHPSRLQRLTRSGLLMKDDTSRGGNRRYYRINAPATLVEFLKGCNLN
jgi:hypothetical protein